MTSRADGAGSALGVAFISAFHTTEADDDGGVATPEGFQNTPDQWHSAAAQKKRGVGDALADAATQRDSQATQVQSLATEPQSFDTQAARASGGAGWANGPSFVDATGSLSGDGSSSNASRLDDVDEDETQIIMSLSQDREAMRKAARRIEEEELETNQGVQPTSEDPTRASGDASDADSDMSDDMLEQDGDINGLSSIAKNFQLSEADLQQEKKPAVYVYKPRMPFQITPPESVVGEDESSGAETEVDEEPETTTTQTFGTNKAGVSEASLVLPPAMKKGFLGKRSTSETAPSQPEEKKPMRHILERSVSCSDVDSTPERTRRARVSLGKPPEGKPPLPRAKRLRLDSAEDVTTSTAKKETDARSASSSQETERSVEADVEDTAVLDEQTPQEVQPTTPLRRRTNAHDVSVVDQATAPITSPCTTPKSNRKRKISSQTSTSDTQELESDDARSSIPPDPSPGPSPGPTIRIMFTGLDGTIPKLRDKVKKIADACQEDDDIENVTHLVAPKNQLKRTVKLLCGISCCDHILDERWLDESARSGAPASETLHCLKDTTAEAKWNFSLYRTMYSVPKAQRRKLFDGLRFFVTNHKSVLPPVKELLKIVECAGGHAEMKGIATPVDIVITSEAALLLATTKKAIASAAPDRIYSPEFILSSILQQNIDYGANRLSAADIAEGANKKKRARK